ncbi:jg16573 [Pararge aegeria aegeria]|uniref:Jg16573 protein n=1 Tax=Pararge aegeria aegeria TaxID=348720 RepID=A0A8S4RD45_9NEOP|nr:jg16573 [Pararge aegeria aegeria]
MLGILENKLGSHSIQRKANRPGKSQGTGLANPQRLSTAKEMLNDLTSRWNQAAQHCGVDAVACIEGMHRVCR